MVRTMKSPWWRDVSLSAVVAGIGTAFWGVVAGSVTLAVQHWRPLR
jgi:predicted benzoate:H+ symporter BenE